MPKIDPEASGPWSSLDGRSLQAQSSNARLGHRNGLFSKPCSMALAKVFATAHIACKSRDFLQQRLVVSTAITRTEQQSLVLPPSQVLRFRHEART